jgi:cysteine desulfuration protein SufE
MPRQRLAASANRDIKPPLLFAIVLVARASIGVSRRSIAEPHMQPDLDTIMSDFDLLDDWEDRYRYIIDLGRSLEPLPDGARSDMNKVQGCVSQVWLDTSVGAGADPVISYKGDSDAHIVRGLVALVLAIYSGQKASRIRATDALEILKTLGLDQHLSPQRSNGLKAMVQRIRKDSETALAAA